MVNLDKLDLREEKLNLLSGLGYSVFRTFAIGAFVVACVRSSLPAEHKVMLIAGLAILWVLFLTTLKAVDQMLRVQSEATFYTRLLLTTSETLRCDPTERRAVLEIQDEADRIHRQSFSYRQDQATVTDALAEYGFLVAGSATATAAAAFIVWYYWDPMLQGLRQVAAYLPSY